MNIDLLECIYFFIFLFISLIGIYYFKFHIKIQR